MGDVKVSRQSLLGLPNRYPGLTYTARQISLFFPKCKTYVECFAGLARTAKYSNCEIMGLNDKSEYSNIHCKKKFSRAIVENMDFIDTIKKYDAKDTFFLIDPPWRTDFYDGSVKYNNKDKLRREIKTRNRKWKLKSIDTFRSFCDRSVKQYFLDLDNILSTIKGHYILTLNKEGRAGAIINSKFTHLVKYHKPMIFGNYPSSRLFSNKPFKRNCKEITDY